ncbi:hypothetical protein HU200_021142 [Digitaria exilis]|uniref:Uncharacterized protein n=1 Tax=Digitaria exilis TaxID=1010633 RepID=A0A835EZW0_9POAL|nr:hypothetical protein HU200_021142 [Digitaria exilis]
MDAVSTYRPALCSSTQSTSSWKCSTWLVHHATVKPPHVKDTSCTDSATSMSYGSWNCLNVEVIRP